MEDDALLAERLQAEEAAMGMDEIDYAQQAIERQRALNATRGLGNNF